MSSMGIVVRGAGAFVKQLGALPREIEQERRKALRLGALMVAGHWKLHLSGPRGPSKLGIVSGNARASIRAGEIAGDRVTIGSPLPYLPPHEFGFSGTVNVRAHTRDGVPVNAHVRQMMLPARPHRAPALRDSTEPVRLLFADRVEEAIAKSRTIGERTKAEQRIEGFG